jgi:hypothetical protein
VTGGGSLERQPRRRQRWEDLAASTSKQLIGLRGSGGYDGNDVNPRGDNDNETTISLAMATATRVAGNKEGDGGKSDDDDTPISLVMATATRVAGDNESKSRKSAGNDKKGCGRATATATKRAMAAATRAAGDKKGDGKGGKSDGDAYKEGNGEEEGKCKGGKSNGDGKEDGEGDKGDGDGDKESDGKEEGKGICNSVFGAQNKCVSQRKKSVPISGPSQITNHKFAIATHKCK